MASHIRGEKTYWRGRLESSNPKARKAAATNTGVLVPYHLPVGQKHPCRLETMDVTVHGKNAA